MGEPDHCGWKDFMQLTTPNRAFVDIRGAGHCEPWTTHYGAPYVAYFSQAWALDHESAAKMIYGDGEDSLVSGDELPLAQPGDANMGPDDTAVLACSDRYGNIPRTKAYLCDN